jgi:hypothetical protein
MRSGTFSLVQGPRAFLPKLFWWYVSPLLRRHASERFDAQHVWPLPARHRAEPLLRRFHAIRACAPDGMSARICTDTCP